MKYRKKPIIIEAIQLFDDDKSIRQVQNFIDSKKQETSNIGTTLMEMDYWDSYLKIVRRQGGIRLKTMESDNETQIASFGDFIIKGVHGEFYPCKPDIFEKTYDPADDYNIAKNYPDESPSGEGDAVDGWISVEKELPEDRPGWSNSADVNICLEGGFVSTGSYSYLLKKWYDYIYNGRLKITHWQKLPKPPIK